MSSNSIDWVCASTELEIISYFSMKNKEDSLTLITENALFLSILRTFPLYNAHQLTLFSRLFLIHKLNKLHFLSLTWVEKLLSKVLDLLLFGTAVQISASAEWKGASIRSSTTCMAWDKEYCIQRCVLYVITGVRGQQGTQII